MWQLKFKDEIEKKAAWSTRALVKLRNLKAGPLEGAIGGAVGGAVVAPTAIDPATGETQSSMPAIAGGAVLGGIAGALVKGQVAKLQRTSNMRRFGGGVGKQVSKDIIPTMTNSQTKPNPAMVEKYTGLKSGYAKDKPGFFSRFFKKK